MSASVKKKSLRPDVMKVTNKLLNRKFVFKHHASGSLQRTKVESESQWDILAFEMPFLRFPDTWEVAIIPPFGGASCRFIARLRGKKESISVYFDSEDALGSRGSPYWEAYPIRGDTARFSTDEHEDMIRVINNELNKNNRKKK